MPKPPEYTKESLEQALVEVQATESSLRSIAKKYNIPRATLQFKLKNPISRLAFGPTPYLSAEEEETIEKWLIDMSRKGFPRKKDDVLNTVQKFLTVHPRLTPFLNNRPGHGWLRAFLKRHPAVVERSSEGVTRASACVTEADIRKWFSEIKDYLKDENLLEVMDHPSRIFNADETGFQTCPSTGRVLAPKGDKNVYAVEQGNAKENITVLFTFSADGKICPPVIVYPYKRLPEKLATTVPPKWGIARSDKGWMTADVFTQFISDVFSPYLTEQMIQRPVILFIDGHKSHITLQLSVLCKEHGIELIALYPNTTRITQPADVSVFGPIKKMWKKAVMEFQAENVGQVITKQSFAPILKKVVDRIKAENLKQGFRACGLYPLDENVIDYSKCLSQAINREQPSGEQKLMSCEDFCRIVGVENIKKMEALQSADESNKKSNILYNLWDFFKINQSINNNESELHAVQLANNEETNLILMQSIHTTTNLEVSSNNDVVEIKITVSPEKVVDLNQPSTSAAEFDTSKAEYLNRKSHSITEYLQQPPENKRKFKRNVEKTPFVITSDKFKNLLEKKTDRERKKEDEKKKKKKRQELLVSRKLKQEESKRNRQLKRESYATKKIKTMKHAIVKSETETPSLPDNDIITTEGKVMDKIAIDNSIVPPGKRIKVISDEKTIICSNCDRLGLKYKALLCGSCNKSYHRSCIPKRHKENLPEEEDMADFMCHVCYKLDDGSEDVSSDNSVNMDELFKMVNKKCK